jgi:hypothetical protein
VWNRGSDIFLELSSRNIWNIVCGTGVQIFSSSFLLEHLEHGVWNRGSDIFLQLSSRKIWNIVCGTGVQTREIK